MQPNNVAIGFMIDWGKDEGNPINVAIRLMIDFGGKHELKSVWMVSKSKSKCSKHVCNL